MYILYTAGNIIEGTDEEELRQIVADINMERSDITEELEIEDFLRVKIYKVDSETYHMSQLQLINQIVPDLVLSDYEGTLSTTPDLTTNKLGNARMRKNMTKILTITVL